LRVEGGKEARLTNLRFADDVLLVAESEHQLAKLLEILVDETRGIGLEIHMAKLRS